MPKRGLAADPLDRLVGPAEQDASAPAASSASNAPSGSKAPKGRVVVKVVADVAEQARAAVLYRQTHGDPLITLAGYIEAAIRDRLEQDKAALTGGADFPPAEVQLRRGRRLGTPSPSQPSRDTPREAMSRRRGQGTVGSRAASAR